MNNLQVLMNGVFGRKVPAEFAAENYDYEAALHDELVKLLCDENGRINRYKFERNKIDLFELLSQNLDEVLPQSVEQAVYMFAEVMRVPQGSRPAFTVTRGKQRGKQFVTRATESGNYETFRLDRDRFDVYPVAIGGAGRVDFERYLDGAESIQDIYEVINEGMLDRIFEMVQEALLSTWKLAGRPARNKVAGNNFDPAAMKKLCNTVAAYGTPVIYCSPEFAAEMVNAIVYNNTTKISDQDMIDVRERGYIGKFQGVNVVVIFSPEHGFRGTADAGEKVSSSIDTKTGVPICSLYGIKGGVPDGKTSLPSFRIVYPLLQSDLNENPNLVQNEGY